MVPLRTNQYRQFHAGAVKNLLGDAEDESVDYGGGVVDSKFVPHNQAGHTERTANQVYRVSSLDMRQLTGYEMEAFQFASERWLMACGLSHGKPSDRLVSKTGNSAFV